MDRPFIAGCPFCNDGGFPVRHREVIFVMIRCCRCNTRGPSFKMDMDGSHRVSFDVFLEPYYAKATEAWNKRREDAP